MWAGPKWQRLRQAPCCQVAPPVPGQKTLRQRGWPQVQGWPQGRSAGTMEEAEKEEETVATVAKAATMADAVSRVVAMAEVQVAPALVTGAD